MVFICTAMYGEAAPFIKNYQLKKDTQCHKFQVFKNEKIILLITGVGKLKAAIGLTYLLTTYSPNEADIFINIGLCGAVDEDIPLGSIFLCNKIIDHDSGRTYYPDVLFTHPFKESSLETYAHVVNKRMESIEGHLVDMEAAGVYEASTVFFHPHQIFIIKVVSDYLGNGRLTQDKVSQLIAARAQEIIHWLEEIEEGLSYREKTLSQREEEMIKRVAKHLKFSTTMENQLKQLLTYYKLQYGDFTCIVDRYIHLPCHSKKEGKMYYAKIRKEIV